MASATLERCRSLKACFADFSFTIPSLCTHHFNHTTMSQSKNRHQLNGQRHMNSYTGGVSNRTFKNHIYNAWRLAGWRSNTRLYLEIVPILVGAKVKTAYSCCHHRMPACRGPLWTAAMNMMRNSKLGDLGLRPGTDCPEEAIIIIWGAPFSRRVARIILHQIQS